MYTRQYYVYILTNRRGTPYTGVTNDLARRLREHREGKHGFTAKYRINRLIYYEAADSPRQAITWEKQIKGWLRSKKFALIRSTNPQFRDLSHVFLPSKPRPSAWSRRASRGSASMPT